MKSKKSKKKYGVIFSILFIIILIVISGNYFFNFIDFKEADENRDFGVEILSKVMKKA